MSRFFLIFTLFAMVVSTTASLAHAHMDVESISGVYISIDSDDVSDSTGDDAPVSNNDCDMMCSGSCLHAHLMFNSDQGGDLFMSAKGKIILSNTNHYFSDLIYDLKRPPKA